MARMTGSTMISMETGQRKLDGMLVPSMAFSAALPTGLRRL